MERIRPLLGGVLLALCVATVLIPSEGAADHGTGIPLVMLFLLLAAVWALSECAKRHMELWLGGTGMALLLLIGWHSISALVMAWRGSPRPAFNMLWEWISLGIAFVLIRQLFRAKPECRAVCAVFLALSVSLSVLGIYQYFVIIPQTRGAYTNATTEERQSMRQRAGVHASEGSLSARRFEDRLMSTEPMATFGLPNSLAAFLSPWLIVSLAVVFSPSTRSQEAKSIRLTALFCLLIAATCLMLTKSRTAFIASLLGAGLLFMFQRRGIQPVGWKLFAATGLLVALLLCLPIATGAFDIEVLSEAPKSVLFRIQYWQATWSLIKDYPWLGCGPGNFKDYYLSYKLPHASEEIRDPHNFLLEIWATAGTPAAAAMLAVLGCFAWRVWGNGRSQGVVKTTLSEPSSLEGESTDSTSVSWVYAAAGTGVLIAVIAGLVVDFTLDIVFLLLAFPVAAGTLWQLSGWVRHGRLPVSALSVAIIVLLVNFSASGGISYPGVATGLWLMMAVSLNLTDADRGSTPISLPMWIRVSLAGVIVLLGIACYWTGYQPNLTPGQDRLSAQPSRDRAEDSLRHWLVSPSQARFEEFERHVKQMLNRSCRSVQAHRQVGIWYWTAYSVSRDTAHGDAIQEALSRVVQFYPNSSMVHAEYAWASHLVGDHRGAAAAAVEAARLDEMNPHPELHLDQRRLFEDVPPETVADHPNSTVSEKSAKLWMDQLRTMVIEAP